MTDLTRLTLPRRAMASPPTSAPSSSQANISMRWRVRALNAFINETPDIALHAQAADARRAGKSRSVLSTVSRSPLRICSARRGCRPPQARTSSKVSRRHMIQP